MLKFGKIRNISGKTSTHRAENIFPKYLLYNVHEIARKYPREKKRYSSFSDSERRGGAKNVPVIPKAFFIQQKYIMSKCDYILYNL
jgi:hypothetical protein